MRFYVDKTASKSWVVPDWPLNGFSPHAHDGSAGWKTLGWAALPFVCVALETICSDDVFVLSASLMRSCRNAAVNFTRCALPLCRFVSVLKELTESQQRRNCRSWLFMWKSLCVLRHTWTHGSLSSFLILDRILPTSETVSVAKFFQAIKKPWKCAQYYCLPLFS